MFQCRPTVCTNSSDLNSLWVGLSLRGPSIQPGHARTQQAAGHALRAIARLTLFSSSGKYNVLLGAVHMFGLCLFLPLFFDSPLAACLIAMTFGFPYVAVFNNGLQVAEEIVPRSHEYSGLLTSLCGSTLACGQIVTASLSGAVLAAVGGDVAKLFACSGAVLVVATLIAAGVECARRHRQRQVSTLTTNFAPLRCEDPKPSLRIREGSRSRGGRHALESPLLRRDSSTRASPDTAGYALSQPDSDAKRLDFAGAPASPRTAVARGRGSHASQRAHYSRSDSISEVRRRLRLRLRMMVLMVLVIGAATSA
jgi:hypothetical protein